MVPALSPAANGVDQRVAQLTRESYGRLVALLAAPTGDISSAEDAVADALERALVRWPEDGIPANPVGWLLTVARNRLRDMWKSHACRKTAPWPDGDAAPAIAGPDDDEGDEMHVIPDRRLELMLVCAHPAIAPNVRTPLMLQTVLGIDAAAIARAFAMPSAAMAQRMVRAKRKIRDAYIPFVLPAGSDLDERLPAVLEAVYGAAAIGFTSEAQSASSDSLSGSALHLATVLTTLLPAQPEVLGLAALLCLSEARRPARRAGPGAESGSFVPLDEQDVALWDRVLIERGEAYLRRAYDLGRPGRYQYEAAIQSAHCDRARTGRVDWPALRRLHRALLHTAPSLGAAVALAAVNAEIDGPAAGLADLDAMTDPALARFQPMWATRAHLLTRIGDRTAAAHAYQRAIELTVDDEVAVYLRQRLAALDIG